MLAALRARRKLSQLKLSLVADVSARHLSFLETGRAFPSRSMVVRLARALELSDGEEAALLTAAGFVPHHLAGELRRQARSSMRSPLVPGGTDLTVAFAIDAAREPAEAVATAAAALRDVGLGQFFTGTLTPATSSSPLVIAHGQLEQAPVGWLLHYRERGYVRIDPLVAATARTHRAFFWADVLGQTPQYDSLHDPRVRRMLAEAAEYRIRGGFVQPLRRADGRVHAVSCMGEAVDPRDAGVRVKARLVSIALLHRIDELGLAGSVSEIVLEAAQADILKWILEGRGTGGIANRRTWCEKEVETIVADLCVRFGTGEPIEAAFRARRFGLI
jgi:transcriptional regulator with XRE-family HTH domain